MTYFIQPHQAKHLLQYSHLDVYLDILKSSELKDIDISTHESLLIALTTLMSDETVGIQINKESKWFKELSDITHPGAFLHHIIHHQNWDKFVNELKLISINTLEAHSLKTKACYGLNYLVLYFKNDVIAFEAENELRVLSEYEIEVDSDEPSAKTPPSTPNASLTNEALPIHNLAPKEEPSYELPKNAISPLSFPPFYRYHLFPLLFKPQKLEHTLWLSHLHARHLFSLAEKSEQELKFNINSNQDMPSKLKMTLSLLNITILRLESYGVCGYKVILDAINETKLKALMPSTQSICSNNGF